MNERIIAARQRLADALRTGHNTTLLRRAIAQIEADDSRAQALRDVAEDAQLIEQNAAIAARAALLASQILQAADDAAQPHQEPN
ncbi:MAG: hypothetical protein AB7O64_14150 [Methylibium sp.]